MREQDMNDLAFVEEMSSAYINETQTWMECLEQELYNAENSFHW